MGRELDATAQTNLVLRCVKRVPGAADELYHQVNDDLRRGVSRRLRRLGVRDDSLVDEIVARVWFKVSADSFAFLEAFDPQRGSLVALLLALAKGETNHFFRSERRRRHREQAACQIEGYETLGVENQLIDEFRHQLSERERRFYDEHLLKSRDDESLSDANRWQLRHRIQRKLLEFISKTK